MPHCARIIFALALSCALPCRCEATERVALIIGNSTYEGSLFLRNPANDVDALETALNELGFTVVKKKDLTLAQMEEALVDFRRKLPKGGLGMFFYAGHGMQVRGENYLVPIGARLREEFEVKRQCLEVSQVLEAMAESEANLKVVVLDCCRDNPLKRGWTRSTSGQGLASISTVPEGTVIAFSTAPNLTAADGAGKSSPYAEQLVASLRSRPTGGLELSEVFREASRAVKQQTGQVPWLNMEASLDKYYLWRQETSGNVPPPAGHAPPAAKMPRKEEPARSLTNSIGMKLVLIPAGEFMMGSRESVDEIMRAFAAYEPKADSFRPERPQHRVRITKAFYMGTFEVTRGQFSQFVAATDYKTDAEKDGRGGWVLDQKGEWVSRPDINWRSAGFAQTDEHPVVNVSWNDAMAFCAWISRKEDKTYRLPTEAEWEYACRAGTTTRYYHGDDPEALPAVGNVADAAAKAVFPSWRVIRASDGYVFTSPVGKFRPNAFGLFDMHGNALEWCSDWFDAEYYSASPTDDPRGPDSGTRRVMRGGAWAALASYCHSTYRRSNSPDIRYYSSGFRVARSD